MCSLHRCARTPMWPTQGSLHKFSSNRNSPV
jgi:hypothetical protein